MNNLPPNSEPTPNPGFSHAELAALEAQLAALQPNGDRLDRERLIFRAGQASAATLESRSRRPWAWPAAFGGMTAAAASLLVALMVQDRPPAVQQLPLASGQSELGGQGTERSIGSIHPVDGLLTTGHSLRDLDRLLAGNLNGYQQLSATGASIDWPAPSQILDVRSYRAMGAELNSPEASL